MNTTTRKHPRTLNEAFPSGTEYANSIEHYRRTDTSGITIVLVVGIVLALAIVGSWLGGMLG
jgi:hypothetical protein